MAKDEKKPEFTPPKQNPNKKELPKNGNYSVQLTIPNDLKYNLDELADAIGSSFNDFVRLLLMESVKKNKNIL